MKKTDKNMNSSMGMYMCFGVAIGTSLGVAFDNIAYGVGAFCSTKYLVKAILTSAGVSLLVNTYATYP